MCLYRPQNSDNSPVTDVAFIGLHRPPIRWLSKQQLGPSTPNRACQDPVVFLAWTPWPDTHKGSINTYLHVYVPQRLHRI